MRDYTVMTDSCCDLPRDYIDRYNIPYVSLICNFMGTEYPDDFGKSLSHKVFYDGMRRGEIPKTSQPSPKEFYKVFRDILDKDNDIICLCASSGLSGTYNSANIAKQMIIDEYKNARISIIDTLTASLGQGLMVIKALEMKAQGVSMDDIVDHIESIKFKLNSYMTVDDLGHLKRGGRISHTAAIVGIVLHIKPILTLDDEGKVMPVLKVKGRKNLIIKLAEFISKKIYGAEDQVIAICHGDSESEALKLKELIMGEIKVKDILINNVGPVVGTYGGPGSLNIFFLGKHRQNHLVDMPV